MAVAPLPNANLDLRLKHPKTTLNKIFCAVGNPLYSSSNDAAL